MLCFSTEPKPCIGSSSSGSLQRQAQAASCGGKGCSSRMLWQGAMADVLGSLPQRIYFIRQEPAEVVGVVLV